MSVAIEAFAIIAGIDLLLMFSGAAIVIVGHHALMQWRLNRPQMPPPTKP